MDKQIKAKWVKALRSGRYKQGRSSLYNNISDSYCCLGVLAKVQKANSDDLNGMGLLVCDLKKYAAGLRSDSQGLLARLNDGSEGTPKTFKEIADYIEKRY